jgi:hypothetical protein
LVSSSTPGELNLLLSIVLLSIVLLTFVLPAYAARTRKPRQALLSLLGAMLLAETAYCGLLFLFG